MTPTERFNKFKNDSLEKSFHAFGFKYIFDKRAQRYQRFMNWLTVFGILVPAIVGSTALGYGIDNNFLTVLIVIAVPISIVQFAFSVLSVIYKWNDEFTYSIEASQAYGKLYDEFKKLGEFPPEASELEKQYSNLNLEMKLRDQQDVKHTIKEKELRRGMRFSLREHKRECYGCKLIPVSMETTKCNVCGNF